MNNFYLAGYYLIKPLSQNNNKEIGGQILSCSRCINLTYFDNWCLSWMNVQLSEDDLNKLQIDSEIVNQIQQWTDKRFQFGSNVFPNIQMAIEYKNLFFKHHEDIIILGLYFDLEETEIFLDEFKQGNNLKEFNYNSGDFALYHNLNRRIEELKSGQEETIGFDFIGVECDGSFHSIYCNNNIEKIINLFKLKKNEYGLFDKPINRKELSEYLNDPINGLEPVPWYIVKVTRYQRASS